MKFSDFFNIEEDEFYGLLSQAAASDICLQDMGRKVPMKGGLTRIEGDVGCFIGVACIEGEDVLGNKWSEVLPAFLTLRGIKIGNGFYSVSFAFDNFRINLDFNPEEFKRDVENFLKACRAEAERIDGRKGVSYLMYGLYCLKHLGVEVSLSGGFPERFMSWDRFSQLVF